MFRTEPYTNYELINSLPQSDVFAVNRMAQWALDSKVSRDAPIWVKEQAYEDWLDEAVDWEAWRKAKDLSKGCMVIC